MEVYLVSCGTLPRTEPIVGYEIILKFADKRAYHYLIFPAAKVQWFFFLNSAAFWQYYIRMN